MRKARVLAVAGCCAAVLLTHPRPTHGARREIRPLPLFAKGALQRSLALALEKLGTEECREVFRDFSDRGGRMLEARLQEEGTTPQQHLQRLRWVNGAGHPRCKDPDVFLVTYVGDEEISVCPRQFADYAQREPMKAAGLILHEQLHALGLGEDPPSSQEISRTVWARCGR